MSSMAARVMAACIAARFSRAARPPNQPSDNSVSIAF